ncbi:5-bromo-4-chloroindolyl phosphate hydrolysis family protein [Methylobacterium sp. Leaf118]|uniref:5-bromo-4-chloroindolyl phosphate hydrolysis family protein n=1 Tax=Methylobacterium sp. Leaf118 TaxID=2876562 RepID=UPI001E2F682C|nr:5-bromo-4-chloroindolyl phosphate hydrolysis family protein [Methylobacterium sp. Leaf118]
MSGRPRLPADPAGGANLWAGFAGGLFAPVATFGLGLPLWASLPGAALVFLGARLALSPRPLFADLDPGSVDAATAALAREVIVAARADLDRLHAAARRVRTGEAVRHLDHLHDIVEQVLARVEGDPRRMPRVRRLLTYYLPAALRLGEGLRVLEAAHRPDAARIAAVGAMIARLDTVFARHADRIDGVAVEGLDVELTLLADALRAEEGPAQAAVESREAAPWR